VPMSPGQLSAALMTFGAAGVAGTLFGGWAADHLGPRRALLLMLPLMATTMLLMPLSAGHYPLLLLALMCWAFAGFSLMPPQQSLLVAAAPAQAPLLLSVNASMLYLGTALGAAVGGLVLSWPGAPVGFARLSWVAAPFILVALAVVWFTSRPTIKSAAA
jgi:MFS transporter, DHA1 family, inner membrane transport protein